MPAMQRGLYVQFLVNDSEQAVYDRSGGPEGGGKLLIKPRGRTLAFGSFVDGLLAHREEEAAQMHRRPTVGSINPYSKEFRFAAESRAGTRHGPYEAGSRGEVAAREKWGRHKARPVRGGFKRRGRGAREVGPAQGTARKRRVQEARSRRARSGAGTRHGP